MSFGGKKLLLFGDSIMYGSGNGGVGVGEYLAEDLGFEVKKYCVGGARVGFYPGKNWMVEQVRAAIENKDAADYIVFDGFTNDANMTVAGVCDVPLGEVFDGFCAKDIFSVTKEDDFSTCLESILAAFKKYFPTAKLLFVRPHKMGRRDAVAQVEYGERAVLLCKKWGAAVADIYKNSGMDTFLPEHRDAYTGDTYGWGKGDCTHPNARGYKEKYMPIIEEEIKKL